MEEQAKWYVIHTYSGYEMMVKDSLEKLIENNNLQEKIVEICIPTEETLEEKANGKKKLVERKKFPCYVFLKMVYSNEIWYMVTNTRGVTGFVGPQGRPLPLTDDEIARNGLETVATNIDYIVGDEVLIVSGTLESSTGKVLELNESNQKAKLLVTMFGRTTEVEVDFVQIKKVTVNTEETN
jgi:transcriptional antiterminator NusG